MSKVEISKQLLTDFPKYNNTQKIDGIQQHPNEMKTINFKQDYVVIIRKKLYYAISQNDEEQYIRVYQVNNFTNLSTSHNVYGRPGTCSVTIKGAERVICAEREQQDLKGWQSWQQLLSGWINLNEGDANSPWTKGKADWALKDADGLDLKNLLKAREAKYGWKFAEKCDFEPMDEIYIFGKTRNKLYKDKNGMYPFKPIFFGYIDKIMKTYTAGTQGLLMTISASDQLKILQYSRISNSPTKMPGVLANGGYDIQYNLDKDSLGYFKLNDNFYEDTTNNNTPYLYTNVFAGKYPYEIITQLALDAGVSKKFLDTRIEKIKKVPFVMQITDKNIELFQANAISRLDFCIQAASKLFVEFFCDEEGNLVLKIPSYSLGANRLPANNMGHTYDQSLYDSLDNPLQNNDLAQIINNNTSTGVFSGLNTNLGTSSIENPNIIWKGPAHSSNYSQGRNLTPDTTICAIVDHITDDSAENALIWFKQQQHPSEDGPSSAHYIVTKSGEIWQVVKDEDTAYHAGVIGSNPTAQIYFDMEKFNPNRYSIGIEHECYQGESLTDIQYKASLQLHNYLCDKFNIPKQRYNIIGHYEVGKDRSFDPGPNFPWNDLIRDLNNKSLNSNTDSVNSSIDYRNLILIKAKEQLGKLYVNGGAGPDVFDCSGLVSYCLNEIGLQVGRLVVSSLNDKSKQIDKSELKTGDLAFHNPYSSNNSSNPPHVGICINEGGEIRWIHAANSRDNVIEQSDDLCQDSYQWTNYGNIIDVLNNNSSNSTNITNKSIITSTTNNIITTSPTKSTVVKSNAVKRIIYEVKNGDSLESIAKQYLQSDLWNEIYMDNQETIGSDPNLIQPGQKLLIYSRDSSDESQNVKAQEMRNSDSNTTLSQKLNSDEKTDSTLGTTGGMGKTLSEQTDQDIPEIHPDEIISFTIMDSDGELYNMYEVQIEPSLLDVNNFPAQAVRRISPDFNSIVRFGMRPAPGVISTPLINSVVEAQLFGTMMLCTSMSKRITGSLNMIEDSSIKIGDPIRFHTYDEHPYKETALFKEYKNQSIFYVDAIERSIDITNVSKMTLTLKAGRMMGQESVFDQMLLLYRYYFDEMPLLNDNISISNLKTKNYIVQASDTWQSIMKNTYKFDPVTNIDRYTSIIQTIIKLNPDTFGTNVSAYSMLNESLVAGNTLIIPDPSMYVTKSTSSSSNSSSSSSNTELNSEPSNQPERDNAIVLQAITWTKKWAQDLSKPEFDYKFLLAICQQETEFGKTGAGKKTQGSYILGYGVPSYAGRDATYSGIEMQMKWGAKRFYDAMPSRNYTVESRDDVLYFWTGGDLGNYNWTAPESKEHWIDNVWKFYSEARNSNSYDGHSWVYNSNLATSIQNTNNSETTNNTSSGNSDFSYEFSGTGTNFKGTLRSFNQYGSEWANVSYGSGTIKSRGCGVVCSAIILSSLGQNVNPTIAARFSESQGYDNLSAGLFSVIGETYGASVIGYTKDEFREVYDKLILGDGLVIVSMNRGHFCGVSGPGATGHYIVLTGTNDDYIKVQDPIVNNYNNYKRKNDYDSVFRNDQGNGRIEVKSSVIIDECKEDGETGQAFWYFYNP